MVVQRVARILWTHKKKTAFGLAVAAYGGKTLRDKLRDDDTRLRYARRAIPNGQEPIKPMERLRRVTVLVNREAGGRKAAQMFKRNALPLLNLAGLEVNIVEVPSESDMESVAQVLDSREADCVFVVGGDGTLCRVLTGFGHKNGVVPRLPIGLFPGGRQNRAFHRIFGQKIADDPVILCCESALALIEGEQRRVWPVKCTIIREQQQNKWEQREETATAADTDMTPGQSTTAKESPEDKTKKKGATRTMGDGEYWLLSDVRAGWLEHCEQREPKLWFWGPLRRRIVYLWEFLKRRPSPLTLQLEYQPNCPGCSHCMAKNTPNSTAGTGPGFFTWLARVIWPSAANPSKIQIIPTIDFSSVHNPSCGTVHESKLVGSDLRVDVEQTENGSKLRLRMGGGEGMGRWEAMRVGWTDRDNIADFYATDIEAGRASIRFLEMPEFVQKLAVAGDWGNLEHYQDKRVVLETTNSGRAPLNFYVPKSTKPEMGTNPTKEEEEEKEGRRRRRE